MNQPPLSSLPGRDLDEDKAVVQLLYRDRSGTIHADPARDLLDVALRDPAGLLWVDILGSESGAGSA
jgi:hypothetical protein